MQLSLVFACVRLLILHAAYSIKIFGLFRFFFLHWVLFFAFFLLLLFLRLLRAAHSLFVAVACLVFTSVLFVFIVVVAVGFSNLCNGFGVSRQLLRQCRAASSVSLRFLFPPRQVCPFTRWAFGFYFAAKKLESAFNIIQCTFLEAHLATSCKAVAVAYNCGMRYHIHTRTHTSVE